MRLGWVVAGSRVIPDPELLVSRQTNHLWDRSPGMARDTTNIFRVSPGQLGIRGQSGLILTALAAIPDVDW